VPRDVIKDQKEAINHVDEKIINTEIEADEAENKRKLYTEERVEIQRETNRISTTEYLFQVVTNHYVMNFKPVNCYYKKTINFPYPLFN
jgi:hypothetical protein